MNKADIRSIIVSNKPILIQYKVKSISLFGSYVRNEQNDKSDVDFLVEFHQGASLFDIVDLQDKLSEILKIKSSVVSKRGLNKYIGPYILKEAEPLAEGF